jgi:hypothetical protein
MGDSFVIQLCSGMCIRHWNLEIEFNNMTHDSCIYMVPVVKKKMIAETIEYGQIHRNC